MNSLWRQLVIRQGVGKRNEPEALDENIYRESRAAARNQDHIRYGRSNPNFIRFGRTDGLKENPDSKNYKLTRHNNNLFMRYRRGGNDFIRFGRSAEYSDGTEDEISEEKRGNNNFMRYGKRNEEYPQDLVEDDDEQRRLNYQMQDALLYRLLAEITCKFDDNSCEELSEMR